MHEDAEFDGWFLGPSVLTYLCKTKFAIKADHRANEVEFRTVTIQKFEKQIRDSNQNVFLN